MADFRQLALEFVLADADSKQTALAQQAARELKQASSDTNPVARWVEAVQPWMPGSNDDVMEDDRDTPDWTSRAKALEFLSQTLNYLDKEVLKPSQVKLLVSFFGAMFDVDHKAGVSPSAVALSRIVPLKTFTPSSGLDLINKVCALRDDFPRQVSTTRTQVYELLRLLITDSRVIVDIKRRDDSSLKFMSNLVQICSAERDPDCLMIWFDILQHFMSRYEPSQTLLEEVFGNFKSYFPITLPRTSQSGVRPEELKTALRTCFSTSSLLVSSVVPFLLAKMDQGDGLTVNVKLDILKTLKACFEQFKNPEESIKPYGDQVWSSLKYEVRNGELEDTIWATLEVLKSVATRLEGNALRDYTLMVIRDCVTDLANPAYTSQAGRLMVAVLSANPTAFALMASPTVTHIKENLRHPKSPAHTESLHKILHVVLETRILMAEEQMTTEGKRDFASVDAIFKSLYEDVYRDPLSKALQQDIREEEAVVAAEAIQGAAALVGQPALNAAEPLVKDALLLPGHTCSQICEALLEVTLRGSGDAFGKREMDELINAATEGLQRASLAYHAGLRPILERVVKEIRSSRAEESQQAIKRLESLGLLLAYVCCSKLPLKPELGMDRYLSCSLALFGELASALESPLNASHLVALAAGMQAVVRHFNIACLTEGDGDISVFKRDTWADYIVTKYPALRQTNLGESSAMETDVNDVSVTDPAQLRTDYLLGTLYITRSLYGRIIQVKELANEHHLVLGDAFQNIDRHVFQQYLHQLATIASLVIHEMTEAQQQAFEAETLSYTLFSSHAFPGQASEDTGFKLGPSWSKLVAGELGVLSLGITKALRPALVSRLFEHKKAQEVIIAATCTPALQPGASISAGLAVASILANRHKIESEDLLLQALERNTQQAITEAAKVPAVDGLGPRNILLAVLAIACGMLRRYAGKEATPLLESIRRLPQIQEAGAGLARHMETLTSPSEIFRKEEFALVKPLWMQKTYMNVIKPMVKAAVGQDPNVQEPLMKMNYSVAVLLMLQHIRFSVFEEDAGVVLRIAIAASQSLEIGQDVKAALVVIQRILLESHETVQDHLRSIVQICFKTFAANSSNPNRPAWLPLDYAPRPHNMDKSEAECSDLALQIVRALPQLFEPQHLEPLRSLVERELLLACGHHNRKVRATARLARTAWVEMK